jgi:hypothetical protein
LNQRGVETWRVFRIRKIYIGDLFLKQWNILQILFFWKKNFVTKERRRLDVHGGFWMDGWMDGWMDERHPSDKCNATTTISDHIRCVVQIQTQSRCNPK